MGNLIMAESIVKENDFGFNEKDFLNSIDLLKTDLQELYKMYTNIIHEKLDNDDLDIIKSIKSAKNIKNIEDQLDNVSSMVITMFNKNTLSIGNNEEMSTTDVNEEVENKTIEIKNNKNLDSLKSFGHSITESFIKTKPLGYKFLSDEMISVKNWKDLYVKTCKQLYNLDEKKFRNFLDNPKMNWTTIKYFTKKKQKTASFVEIVEGVYINTLFGANEYMTMIKKMLEEYKIDIVQFRVFLK